MKKLYWSFLLLCLTLAGAAQEKEWKVLVDSATTLWNGENVTEVATILEKARPLVLASEGKYSSEYYGLLSFLSEVYSEGGSLDYPNQMGNIMGEQMEINSQHDFDRRYRIKDSLQAIYERTDTQYINHVLEMVTIMDFFGHYDSVLINEVEEIKHELYLKKGTDCDEYVYVTFCLFMIYDAPHEIKLKEAVSRELFDLTWQQLIRQELDIDSKSSSLAVYLSGRHQNTVYKSLGIKQNPLLQLVHLRIDSEQQDPALIVTELIEDVFLESSDTILAKLCFDRFLENFAQEISTQDNRKFEFEQGSTAQALRELKDTVESLYSAEHIYSLSFLDSIAVLYGVEPSDSFYSAYYQSMNEELEPAMRAMKQAASYQADVLEVSGFDSLEQAARKKFSYDDTTDYYKILQWKTLNEDKVAQFKESVEKLGKSEVGLKSKVECFTDIYLRFNSSEQILFYNNLARWRELRFKAKELINNLDSLFKSRPVTFYLENKNFYDVVWGEYEFLLKTTGELDMVGSHIESLRTWSEYRNALLNIAFKGDGLDVVDLFGKPEENFICLNELMALKGAELRSRKLINDALISTNSEVLLSEYLALLEGSRLLSELSQLDSIALENAGHTYNEIHTQVDSLQSEYDTLIGYVSPYIKSGVYSSKWSVGWEQIQNELKDSEAFVDIERIQDSVFPSMIRYLVFIITPKRHELLVLEDGPYLDNGGFNNYLESIGFAWSNSRGIELMNDSVNIGNNDVHLSSRAYQTFWEPIQRKLAGVKRVYLLPDGIYYQLSLGTLFNSKSGLYVLDELEIIRLNDVVDMLSYFQSSGKAVTTNSNFVLFGDPEYPSNRMTVSQMSVSPIKSLPYTRTEVLEIDSLLATQSIRSVVFLGKRASEENLKNCESPSVLHIAAHGYYISPSETANGDLTRAQRTFLQNPFLQSGLLLSGSHYTENGLHSSEGVLTAEDASHLKLQNTELVVLSACETGLGELMPGEGVMGLQRAFAIAGAETVLMSLWQIDDAVTQQLMTTFYYNWLVLEQPKRQAFANAQKALKEEYPAPYYWGGFVMVGKQ